jgi:hypothetical protein
MPVARSQGSDESVVIHAPIVPCGVGHPLGQRDDQ